MFDALLSGKEIFPIALVHLFPYFSSDFDKEKKHEKKIFLKTFLIFFLYDYIACICVSVPMLCKAYKGQKKALDHLKLKFWQLLGSTWVLGLKPRPSTKAVSALNH